MSRYLSILLLVLLLWSSSGFARNLEPDWNHSGKLESLGEDKINISDSSYSLSPAVKFMSTSGRHVTSFNFEKGDKVVVSLDEKGVVIGVWLVDEELP
jgi:hypothetical protein